MQSHCKPKESPQMSASTRDNVLIAEVNDTLNLNHQSLHLFAIVKPRHTLLFQIYKARFQDTHTIQP